MKMLKGSYVTHVSQPPLRDIINYHFKDINNITINSTESIEADVIEVCFTLELTQDVAYEVLQEFTKSLTEVGEFKDLKW